MVRFAVRSRVFALVFALALSVASAACGASVRSDVGYLATSGHTFPAQDENALHDALVASAMSDARCKLREDVLVVTESSRISVVDACGKRLTYVVDHTWTLVLASSMQLGK